MKNKILLLLGLMVAVFAYGAQAIAADGASMDKPKAELNAGVKPGDCVGCHKDGRVLPKKHVATADLKLKDCKGCHGAKADGPEALPTNIPLWHLHGLQGIQCGECHQGGQEVTMVKCLTCHDTKAVAEKTADLKPTNPHNSRHYGTEADCNLCHHQHKASENHCASCHKFDFKVP